MLAVIRAQFAVDWTRPGWIEDELVRRGARDAHLVDDDVVSVTVVANSRREAEELVEDLLIRVGATPLGIAASGAERAVAGTAPSTPL